MVSSGLDLPNILTIEVMTDSNSIQKPQSIWQREIQVDVKGLLAASAKLGVQSFFSKWNDVAETGVEVLDTLGLKRSQEEIAGVLLLKSLKRAIHSLLKENRDLILGQNTCLDRYEALDIQAFQQAMIAGLLETAWAMNSDFFQRPKNLPMLEPVQDSLASWLQRNEITAVDAKNLSRYP